MTRIRLSCDTITVHVDRAVVQWYRHTAVYTRAVPLRVATRPPCRALTRLRATPPPRFRAPEVCHVSASFVLSRDEKSRPSFRRHTLPHAMASAVLPHALPVPARTFAAHTLLDAEVSGAAWGASWAGLGCAPANCWLLCGARGSRTSCSDAPRSSDLSRPLLKPSHSDRSVRHDSALSRPHF